MYLETWMIVVLLAAFGFCAITSFFRGRNFGAELAIKMLLEHEVVSLSPQGKIVKYYKQKP